jgi:CubicO group peptidase (beta-lactamase class C family)
MEMDEGKVDWDKPVRDYLPTFKMFTPDLTEQMTIRDLITPRSGLPRHDLMWYSSDFSREDLLRRLQFLEPSKPLRTTFQYHNLCAASRISSMGSSAPALSILAMMNGE